MKISPINLIPKDKYRKVSQPEGSQKIDDDMLFIRMRHYKKKHLWAQKMTGLIYEISSMVKEDKSFDEVYSKTLEGINEINGSKFGTERQQREAFFLCPYDRGEEYFFTYYNIIDRTDKWFIVICHEYFLS